MFKEAIRVLDKVFFKTLVKFSPGVVRNRQTTIRTNLGRIFGIALTIKQKVKLLENGSQACNQLGTTGGAKRFLRGAKIV